MNLFGFLFLWAKRLLSLIDSLYAMTGPGRVAHSRAVVYENLAKQHTYLSSHLHAIDRLLRKGHDTMLQLIQQPESPPAGKKNRQQQGSPALQLVEQRHSSKDCVPYPIQAKLVADNIANLKRERQEIQDRLDCIAEQMKLISK